MRLLQNEENGLTISMRLLSPFGSLVQSFNRNFFCYKSTDILSSRVGTKLCYDQRTAVTPATCWSARLVTATGTLALVVRV